MVPPEEPVRRRRSGRSGGTASGTTIAVTGAATGLGHAFTLRIASATGVRRTVAVDVTRPPDTDGVTWRRADVRDPLLAGTFRGVEIVVHLALDLGVDSDPMQRRAQNERGTLTVLTAAAAASVRRVVLLTSAMVYGALPDNPQPLPDDAPVRAVVDGATAAAAGSSLLCDLLEIERLAAVARDAHPALEVTVVRPATLVGPGTDGVVLRHFDAPRLLVVKGSEPRWQFCHVDDLLAALELAALGHVEGSVNVACEGALDQAEVEAVTGLRRIELPSSVAYGAAARLHRLGVTPAPPSDLGYLVHPWVVDCARLRAAGWTPSYDNATALRAHMAEARGRPLVAGRRLDRKDATRAAAGAAVAVVGTAALVRRARRRRRG